MTGNYYDILGINQAASPDEIKKAYRKLSLKFHPDKNEGDEYFSQMFRQVNLAYNSLIDPEKRKFYDSQLREQLNAKNSAERLKKLEEELRRKEQALRQQPAYRNYEPQQTVYNNSSSRHESREYPIKIKHVKYFLWVVIIGLLYAIGSSGKNEVPATVQEKSSYVKPKKKTNKKKMQKRIETPVINSLETVSQTVIKMDSLETGENTGIELKEVQLPASSDTTGFH